MFLKIATMILCSSLITSVAKAADPVTSGFVTSIEPDGTFWVAHTHVKISSVAMFYPYDDKPLETASSTFHLFVGESVVIYGTRLKRTTTDPIVATRILQLAPALGEVHGTAIIDFVPTPILTSTDHIVRASGFFLRIPTTAKVTFEDPLTPASGFATNVWLDYHGTMQKDGTVVVDVATLRKNTVTPHEKKFDKKNEYDPAAVDPSSDQSEASKFFLGFDQKKLPPHQDVDLQARITRIGNSLIPTYQRSLAPDDATHFNFRFQIVDTWGFDDVFALPNGIILIPFSCVDRLKSDSELATPLAIAIAFALEKEQFRGRTAQTVLTAAEGASYAAIPLGIGPGVGIGVGLIKNHLNELQWEQVARVALCLLHDAGYDIRLAPVAIWLTTPDEAKPIEKIRLPPHAAKLYQSLGTIWQPTGYAATH